MKLDQIRKDIDQIDQELVALLEKRMVCVGQIVEYKEQQGLPVLDQGREREVLEKVASLVGDEQYRSTIQAQFRDLMARSRDFQEEVKARD
ncbi:MULTISPECIES: chorismate mutase [Streptococcus]|uniref:Chorismate mutase n=1 Tax=Streptococcus lactarius TaxID=684066 RepID=A0A9X0WMB3_9STRE|nr:chorismate mutase [Streptococcus lactarius]MBK4778662.1 chorismate mutase [Streptococcus lactarius]QUB39854.1 chorismate mutase [Streptococcus lactarius]